MRLFDKYQPQTFEEFIGQDKAINRVRRIIDRESFQGDAFWISGPSGTGKTTLAWILAKQFSSDLDIVEIDGESCTVERVRQASESMRYTTLSGGFRAYIVNEAQAMTAKAVQAWLTVLDKLPTRVLILFTTTDDSGEIFGAYDGPFMSRCKKIQFTNQGLAKPFAARAREIAQAENMDGKPESEYVKLVQKHKNNMRAVLQAIDAGELLD